ncbi:hypothetical protein [Modestobacter sp. SYSU DS0290]
MTVLPALHLALVAACAGPQWTVRGVVPPSHRPPRRGLPTLHRGAPAAAPAAGQGSSAAGHRRLLRVDTARVAVATGNVLATGRVARG